MTSILGPGRFWSIFKDVIDARHPDPEVLNLEDISISLGNICRFGGHLRDFYSVADHSRFVARILVARNVDQKTVLAGLVHDVVEVITGDIISPMKPIFGEGLKQVDDLWTPVVEKFFGLESGATSVPEVKAADLAAYYVENQILRGWPGQHVQHLNDAGGPTEAMEKYGGLWRTPLLPYDSGMAWFAEMCSRGFISAGLTGVFK